MLIETLQILNETRVNNNWVGATEEPLAFTLDFGFDSWRLGRLVATLCRMLISTKISKKCMDVAKKRLEEVIEPHLTFVLPAMHPRGSPFLATREAMEKSLKQAQDEMKLKELKELPAIPVHVSTRESLLEAATGSVKRVQLAEGTIDNLLSGPVFTLFHCKPTVEALGYKTSDVPIEKLSVKKGRWSQVACAARVETLRAYAFNANALSFLDKNERRAILMRELGLEFSSSLKYKFVLVRSARGRVSRVSASKGRGLGKNAWRDDHTFDVKGSGLSMGLTLEERLCPKHCGLVEPEAKKLSQDVFAASAKAILRCSDCKSLYNATKNRTADVSLVQVTVKNGTIQLLAQRLEEDVHRLANVFALKTIQDLSKSATIGKVGGREKTSSPYERLHSLKPPRPLTELERILNEDRPPSPPKSAKEGEKHQWMVSCLEYL